MLKSPRSKIESRSSPHLENSENSQREEKNGNKLEPKRKKTVHKPDSRQQSKEDFFSSASKIEEDEELNSRSFKSGLSGIGEEEKVEGQKLSRRNSKMSGISEEGGDSILDRGSFGTFSRQNSGNSLGDEELENLGNDEGKTKLECPKSTMGKIFFILFFPTFFIFWLTMPDIKKNPDISKVMLISILMFFFSAIFGYFVYQLEASLILAWELKTEMVGLFNGFLLSIG